MFNPSVNNLQVPVIYFPKRQKGLKRKKRDWVIPDINFSENDRGPYPCKVSQVRDALLSRMWRFRLSSTALSDFTRISRFCSFDLFLLLLMCLFQMFFFQIRSNEDKLKVIYYSISGPGATEHPVGLFYMDRTTGNLFVTQPLDREERAQYKVSNP